MEVEKTLLNECGHRVWYRVRTVKDGVDIDSDINGSCDVCVREDAKFKSEIAQLFRSFFRDI